MFIFANLIFAVAQVLDYVLWAYMWILVGRIVVSLVRADCPISPCRNRAGIGASAGEIADCRQWF